MYIYAMRAFPLRQHQGSTFSQARTIPSSWFRYKRIDSYPRPVFCLHFFRATLRMLVEVDRWEWSHDHFPSVPSDMDTLFSNSFQMFCRDFEPRLCSLAVGLLRDDHVNCYFQDAWTPMHGNNSVQVCDGDGVGSQLLVDRWCLDVECFGGGECESWLFQCFYFSGFFYSELAGSKENWPKLFLWWKAEPCFSWKQNVRRAWKFNPDDFACIAGFIV